MEVKFSSSRLKAFRDIARGETFEYNGKLYQKYSELSYNSDRNTVCICEGYVTQFGQDCMVRPVKGAFVED